MTSRNEVLSTTENVQARHVTAKYWTTLPAVDWNWLPEVG